MSPRTKSMKDAISSFCLSMMLQMLSDRALFLAKKSGFSTISSVKRLSEKIKKSYCLADHTGL